MTTTATKVKKTNKAPTAKPIRKSEGNVVTLGCRADLYDYVEIKLAPGMTAERAVALLNSKEHKHNYTVYNRTGSVLTAQEPSTKAEGRGKVIVIGKLLDDPQGSEDEYDWDLGK